MPAVKSGATAFRFGVGPRNQLDGYRLMLRRDDARIRCLTRNGRDWADRFPAIVDAAKRIKSGVVPDQWRSGDRMRRGTPDFRELRSKRRGP